MKILKLSSVLISGFCLTVPAWGTSKGGKKKGAASTPELLDAAATAEPATKGFKAKAKGVLAKLGRKKKSDDEPLAASRQIIPQLREAPKPTPGGAAAAMDLGSLAGFAPKDFPGGDITARRPRDRSSAALDLAAPAHAVAAAEKKIDSEVDFPSGDITARQRRDRTAAIARYLATTPHGAEGKLDEEAEAFKEMLDKEMGASEETRNMFRDSFFWDSEEEPEPELQPPFRRVPAETAVAAAPEDEKRPAEWRASVSSRVRDFKMPPSPIVELPPPIVELRPGRPARIGRPTVSRISIGEHDKPKHSYTTLPPLPPKKRLDIVSESSSSDEDFYVAKPSPIEEREVMDFDLAQGIPGLYSPDQPRFFGEELGQADTAPPPPLPFKRAKVAALSEPGVLDKELRLAATGLPLTPPRSPTEEEASAEFAGLLQPHLVTRTEKVPAIPAKTRAASAASVESVNIPPPVPAKARTGAPLTPEVTLDESSGLLPEIPAKTEATRAMFDPIALAKKFGVDPDATTEAAEAETQKGPPLPPRQARGALSAKKAPVSGALEPGKQAPPARRPTHLALRL